MRLRLVMLVLLGGLWWLAPLAQAAAPVESLVPGPARISDDEARLLLAELYWREGRMALANARLAQSAFRDTKDGELLLRLAQLQARMGHAAQSRALFERAVPLARDEDAARLVQAQAMNIWGDFYRAEAIYRDYLGRHPNDSRARLALARVLLSEQRYQDAETAYLVLLDEGSTEPRAILRGLCELKWAEKDLAGCLAWCDKLLAQDPQDPVGREYRARVNLRHGELAAAAKDFSWLAGQPGYEAAGLLGLGRVYEKQGLTENAAQAYTQAAASPNTDREAMFRHLGEREASSKEFLAKLTKPGALGPPQLMEWAKVYREHGLWAQAVTCYKAALAVDPKYFPARLDLAETLAISHQYGEANKMLAELAEEYPGVSKVLLTQARALAWSERYQEAIAIYLAMHRLNPKDKVPLLEAGRAAAWAKDMDQARALYARLLEEPVSTDLAACLAALEGLPPSLQALGRRAAEAGPGEGAYLPYEELAGALAAPGPELDPDTLAKLEKLTAELRPRYRDQKAAHLELAGKEASFNKRPFKARDRYRELVALQPGNQEARFDLAQTQCALGLGDEEQASYAELLELDPLHNRAGAALKRAQGRTNPLTHAGYAYWSEDGRGEAARITRHRANAGVEVPLTSRFSLSATGHQWWELPHRWGGEAEARGFTLAADGRLSELLEAHAAWTRKMYQDDDLGDLDLGRAWLGIRLWDYAFLKLGWSKEDEIKNAFSLRQGTTRQEWWLSADSNLTRKWEAGVMARYLDYSDDNQGVWTGLNLAYALMDHPDLLKLALQMDYRDSQHQTREIYQGDQLVDMTYPYWTPQDWLGGNLALIYRHDYSPKYVCGGELRYYELRLSAGTDSEGNAMAALEAGWHHEFWDNWSLDARGLVHRSGEWDANGLWFYLGYRF